MSGPGYIYVVVSTKGEFEPYVIYPDDVEGDTEAMLREQYPHHAAAYDALKGGAELSHASMLPDFEEWLAHEFGITVYAPEFHPR